MDTTYLIILVLVGSTCPSDGCLTLLTDGYSSLGLTVRNQEDGAAIYDPSHNAVRRKRTYHLYHRKLPDRWSIMPTSRHQRSTCTLELRFPSALAW